VLLIVLMMLLMVLMGYKVIASKIEAMPYRAQKQSLLSLKITDNAPTRVIGDSTRLSQVLINLIDNSLKFTEESGKVDIYVSTISVDKDVLVLKLEVSDNGIGIPESSQNLLFKQFSQIDNTS
jgi:signal transduction histidine kinase